MEGAAGQGGKSESFGAAFCWFSQENVIRRRVLSLLVMVKVGTAAALATDSRPLKRQVSVERGCVRL